MATKLEPNIDLSTIVSGTGEYFMLGSAQFGSLASIEIEQLTVNNSGVTIRVVESNSGINWFDVLNSSSAVVEVITTSNTDPELINTEFVKAENVGLFIDVPAATTGQLSIVFNIRNKGA